MATCPQDVKPAGPGSIAEQTVDHHVDVVLGGGKQRYDQKITGGPDAGKSVIESAERQGYKVVTNRADLLAYRGSKLLLGLFTAGNMTTEWNGALASPYPGSGPQRCNEANRPANEPTLAEMTRVAIDRLDDSNGRGWSWKKKRHESDGFFLQVEGASIDKQDHAQNPCAQIGETVAFDEAVQVGLAYAARHKDTLVIVTADHGHTSQIIEPQSATDHSPGAISTLVTADGVNMVVNYATNLNGRSQSHTGTQIRVAAQGPQAANVLGLVDQTDLFRLMKRAMGAS
jgi:alkaline phosphatase/streptomycin-6-phosphatase